MGSPEGSGPSNEHPQHRVRSAAFCMDTTEVTVAAYRDCTAAQGCTAPDPFLHQRGNGSSVCNWGRPETDRHPVNCVDWNQARAYCEWKDDGRLPTEAEWEYAARGSEGRAYPWGNAAPDSRRANLCGSECIAALRALRLAEGVAPIARWRDAWGLTAPVGSFPAGNTPECLQDMGGNVLEWTEDGYDAAAYRHRPAGFTAQQVGSRSTAERVVRGGAWSHIEAAELRAATRNLLAPASRYGYLGFRCARGAR